MGVFASALISCTDDRKNAEDNLFENGSFSFMGETFGITEVCVTNSGFKEGIYSVEINIKNKNNNSIYFYLTSATKDLTGRYAFGLGHRKYTDKSFIKIRNNVYPLSEGWINFYMDSAPQVSGMCRDIHENSLNISYHGTFNYTDESGQQPILEDLGVGFFTYLNSTNEITMGSLHYYGLDTEYGVKDYALFLQNKEGNYLRFLIFCRDDKDICEGDYSGYDDLWYVTADTKQPNCFSVKYSGMCYGSNNRWEEFGGGHVYINVIDSIYDIEINCRDDIMDASKTGDIKGHYKGMLWYHDFSSSSYLGEEGPPPPPISIK
ncbi:hypothetical protein FACS189437_06380 [Bacteroidia bacterium]|nr:hypothetical protein FACS189437_06380 [Bacteroidia bacterium]